MPARPGTREKLLRTFDQAQKAYDKWSEATQDLQRARVLEEEARKEYAQAKSAWESTVAEATHYRRTP